MNDILTEKEYQHFIMDRLSQDNGWTGSCCFSF